MGYSPCRTYLFCLKIGCSRQSISKWKEDVGRLTRMIYEPFPGTVKAELAFWEALRCAVEKGLDELQTPGVLLTLEILHRSNRNINM